MDKECKSFVFSPSFLAKKRFFLGRGKDRNIFPLSPFEKETSHSFSPALINNAFNPRLFFLTLEYYSFQVIKYLHFLLTSVEFNYLWPI